MRPQEIAKSHSESAEQKAFFAYCAMAKNFGFEAADVWAAEGDWQKIEPKPIPDLAFIFHVPNGGSRGDDKRSQTIRGANLKAEGVKEGVWDIFWPKVVFADKGNCSGSVRYCGLWIEMKTPSEKPKKTTSKGGVSDKQIEFGNFVHSQQYALRVCYSWEEAVEALKLYCKVLAFEVEYF